MLEKKLQKKIPVTFAVQRTGDQSIFIADIRKAAADFKWEPKIGVEQGIEMLFNWVQEQKYLFR